MTLSIRDPETDHLARSLSKRLGKSITAVVREALDDYAIKAPRTTYDERLAAMEVLYRRWDAMPVVDPRSAKEIMDDLYDDHGLPK